jgi:hypothetical protein
MNYRFEDYKVVTGRTKMGNLPYATLEEFASLIATGKSSEEALNNLRKKYLERVARHLANGKPIPAPGSGKVKIGFALDGEIWKLGFVVEDFWKNILGTSLTTSVVSNESRLSSWEHYCGGRDVLIQRVLERYSVDISTYSEPIPIILKKIKEGSVWRAMHNDDKGAGRP